MNKQARLKLIQGGNNVSRQVNLPANLPIFLGMPLEPPPGDDLVHLSTTLDLEAEKMENWFQPTGWEE